jgi:hypothetical protein
MGQKATAAEVLGDPRRKIGKKLWGIIEFGAFQGRQRTVAAVTSPSRTGRRRTQAGSEAV